MPRRRAVAFVLLGTLAAAACQPEQRQAVTVTRAGMPAAPGPEASRSVTAMADPIEPGDDDGEQLAAATRLPSDIATNPTTLRGMEARLIRAAFGSPTFRRREKSAEVWQYYGQGCILDLFLYQEEGQQRVTHYQLRNRDSAAAVDSGCYAGLIKSR